MNEIKLLLEMLHNGEFNSESNNKNLSMVNDTDFYCAFLMMVGSSAQYSGYRGYNSETETYTFEAGHLKSGQEGYRYAFDSEGDLVSLLDELYSIRDNKKLFPIQIITDNENFEDIIILDNFYYNSDADKLICDITFICTDMNRHVAWTGMLKAKFLFWEETMRGISQDRAFIEINTKHGINDIYYSPVE